MFSSPYDAAADQNIGAVIKPGASNITAYYKTLANAAHFTQGALARDASGKACAPDSIRAKSWDAIGILYGVARVGVGKPIDGVSHALAAVDLAANRLYRQTIRAVNDDLGHEAVLHCLRLAYKRQK